MEEAGAEVVTEVPMKTKKGDDVPIPTVPYKGLRGKQITLPDKVEGDNIEGWEGKKVAVLGAGPKAYKIREVGEDGKLTGPIKYVTPSQIQGETAPDVETKAPKEVKPKPKAKPKPKVATDKVTKDDIFGEPEIPEEQSPTPTAELETESPLEDYKKDITRGDNTIEESLEYEFDLWKDELASGETTEAEVKSRAKNSYEIAQNRLKEFEKDPLAYLEKDLKSWYDYEKSEGKKFPENIEPIKDAIAEFKKEQQVPTPTSPAPSKVSKVKKLTSALLRKNKDKVYLFGDNLLGRGKGGQAVIRDEPNAVGIPTKKAPSMKEGSFFDDADYLENVEAIDKAFAQIPKDKEVVIPEDGLGTGRARLEKEAPRTFKYLQDRLAELEQGTTISPTPTVEKQAEEIKGLVTPADIQGQPELPEGTPDVTTAPESLEEFESEVQENQLRAEQRTKDYLIDGTSYKRVSNVIKSTFSGEPNKQAVKAGNTVDDLVRSFFTEGETPVHDDTLMSKDAYDSLIKDLQAVQKSIDDKGLTVLANNIVVWDDASGVAGEVDLLVLNPETGNIQIWDIKTSKASTKSPSYTKVWKGNGIERSKKQQHQAQLSAYKRIIENQYGMEVEKIAIFPFKVDYRPRGNGKIVGIQKESGFTLDFDAAFINTIIPPNKLSQNIEPTPKEDITEPPAPPIGINEEPDDSQIANFRNTVLGDIASQSNEESGHDIEGKDIEQDSDENRNMFQKEKVSPLPKITSNAELAQKIVSRLRKHFGDYITDDTFEGTLDANGKRAVGVAINNIALWSSTDATLDTMPHEYAHIYVGLLKDTDLIKRAINQFESEEKLVQYIGEYYANRIQNRSLLNRLKVWLKQFANRLRNIFRGVPDNALGDFIAEEFYQGRWAGEVGLEYSPYAMYQEQGSLDEDGNDTGVNSSRHTTDTIPSDIHQSEFFSRVFGVHIPKAQVPVLSEMARKNDSFESYLEDIKKWAEQIGKEKSYRVAIKTEFKDQDLQDLKIMYLKDRAKIPRYSKEQVGLFTRVYRSLILPTGKQTKTKTRIIISPSERLDTKTKESQFETTNFFEEALKRGEHNLKLIHLRTKDILNEWLNPDTNEIVYWTANTRLTREVLDKVEGSEYQSYIKQIIKYGNDDANLLFIVGMKAGNDNSILMGKVPNEYNEFTVEDFENYLNSEVKAERLKPEQAEVMLEEWVTSDEQAQDWSLKFVNQYKPELLEGETLKDARIRIAREIFPHVKNMKIRQAIGIHEYMKQLYYNKYALDEKHILDTYNRLRLPLSNGYSPHTGDNSLDSRVMIVPKNTQVKIRTKDGLFDGGTLGDGDGSTITGSEWFNRLGENIGTPNVSALKTVIQHRSKDGNDYLAMKHLQMVPFVGEEYYKEGENTPFARVAVGKGGTFFEALDKNGNVTGTFQHLNTPNESKIRAGKFTNDYQINDLVERDVKVIMNPVGSSDTAAHPIALGEILLDPSIIENPDTPEAMRLAKAIMNHYGDVAEEYLSMLRTMRKNPKTFLNAVKRTREEGRIPTEAEKYIDLLEKTNGQGVAHKQLTNLFVSYLKNRYFSDGIFKGKRIGKGNATHAYLKPARHLENLIEDGNVAISYDNSTVRSKVIDHWASFNRASIERQIPNSSKWSNSRLFYHFAKEKTFQEKLDILNNSLNQGDGVNLIIHRQPIAKVTGVVTRRIQFLVGGGHGDTMFLKNKDVVEVLDGDWDGDHGFAEFIDGEFLKAYQDWQNSNTFEDKNNVVALPMFGQKMEEMTDSNTSYTSIDSRDAAILGNAAVAGSQGRVTNVKTVMTQLAYKEFKMYLNSLKGGYISAKNPSDVSIMEYITLDENQLNKDNGKLLDLIYRNGDSIVDAEGNEVVDEISTVEGVMSIDMKGEPMYLKTTVEGELAILLQMAVDDKKFGFLSKIGWTMDFPLRRIFKRSDGETLTKGNIKSLRVLFNVQNFSSQRAGLTPSKNVASMSKIVEDSRDLASRFFAEDNTKAKSEEAGLQMVREFLKQKENMRFKTKIENPSSIQTNGKITPGEFLISSVGIEYNNMIKNIEDVEQAGSHFLDWSETAYETAHGKTINELGKDPKFNEDKWNESDLSLAYEFLVSPRIDVLNDKGEVVKKTSLNDSFWQIYIDAQKKNDDDVPLHISSDYNEFLNKFVESNIEDWNALSNNVQDLVSVLFLKGIGKRTNILTLMPFDLMSPRILEKFLPMFENNLKTLTEADYATQTGNKRAKAGYKNLAQLSIQGSKAHKKIGNKLKPRCK